MPDPTTYSYTTASVPEWAEAATGDARDAEIARLRDENCALTCRNGDLDKLVTVRGNGMTSLEARVKELTDDNGDLASELVHRDAEWAELLCAARDLVGSIENWKLGDRIEAALIDGDKIVNLAEALDTLRTKEPR